MRNHNTIEIEYQVCIADLVCYCIGEVEYFINDTGDIVIKKSTFKFADYQLSKEHCELPAAVAYYNDYRAVKYEEVVPYTLKELLQLHCDLVALQEVENYLKYEK